MSITMRMKSERGIAMVLALFLMSVLSVLAASMMFLSQTETYATMNYRMMSQARYAAEAGVQKAADFLLDPTKYAPPGGVGDPLANYDRTKSPVTWNNAAVVLSATASKASNYPANAVVTAFNNAAKSTLLADKTTLAYSTYATLIAMQTFDSYGGGTSVVQTWEITADGSLANSTNATVEVVALIETPRVPASSYAAFATANVCGALHFHGNVDIDSYDSTNGGTYATTQANSGGNVGTNGNFQVDGNAVDVMGNLYSPREGTGSCSNNGTIPALTGKTGTIWGSVVKLPTAVSYPTPTFSVWPNPNSTVTVGTGATCAAVGLTSGAPPAGNCSVDASSKTLKIDSSAEITLPNVTVANGWTLEIVGKTGGQTVNVNSIDASGGSIAVTANTASNNNESVILKVAGKNPTGVTSGLPDPSDMTTPISFSTWKQNSSASAKYDASSLQIVYPGTGTLDMDGGNSQSAGVIYAPNASFNLRGTQDWYGSILAAAITNGGNSKIHYDRRLSHDFYVAGRPMAGTFNWKKSS